MNVPPRRPRVYIVEDEPKLAAILDDHLRRNGFEPVTARRFDDIKSEFVAVEPDLVLLDINLPWFDGFYWCRQIRTISTAPIIFVTARDGTMDQVLAIDNGGDDYVVKPFNLEVVTAKVRGALRRAYGEYALTNEPDLSVEYAGVTWDPLRLTARYEDGRAELSRNEGQLLASLLAARGTVVARETLLEALWDDAEFVDDNTLTVNVTRLRRKLAEIGLGSAVRTVRGEGYRFEVDAPTRRRGRDSP